MFCLKKNFVPIFLASIILNLFLLPSFGEKIAAEKEFEPETESFIEKLESEIRISANAEKTSVYLNGDFFGLTPLTIKNLSPGFYKIALEKKHFEKKTGTIQIVLGKSRNFFVELEKISAPVKFVVPEKLKTDESAQLQQDNELEGVSILVDDVELKGQYAFLSEGSHEIVARKFGCKEFRKIIQVFEGIEMEVELDFIPDELSASNFTVAQKKHRLSKINGGKEIAFSFDVNANGYGFLSIYKNSSLVKTIRLSGFQKNAQKVLWDGKDDRGNFAGEGKYLAELEIAGKKSAVNFEIRK